MPGCGQGNCRTTLPMPPASSRNLLVHTTSGTNALPMLWFCIAAPAQLQGGLQYSAVQSAAKSLQRRPSGPHCTAAIVVANPGMSRCLVYPRPSFHGVECLMPFQGSHGTHYPQSRWHFQRFCVRRSMDPHPSHCPHCTLPTPAQHQLAAPSHTSHCSLSTTHRTNWYLSQNCRPISSKPIYPFVNRKILGKCMWGHPSSCTMMPHYRCSILISAPFLGSNS
jgi:hypothetical protein